MSRIDTDLEEKLSGALGWVSGSGEAGEVRVEQRLQGREEADSLLA